MMRAVDTPAPHLLTARIPRRSGRPRCPGSDMHVRDREALCDLDADDQSWLGDSVCAAPARMTDVLLGRVQSGRSARALFSSGSSSSCHSARGSAW